LPGQLLAVIALGALTATVIEVRPLGWRHPMIIAGIVLTLVTWPAFLWVEATSRAPMLPLRIFRNPGFAAAVAFGVAVNLTYYGIVFVLSLYLQRVQGYSALEAGFAYLPLTATFFAINVWSGKLIGRIGARKPMMFGALIDAFGFALLGTLAADSAYWQMLPAFALLPAGMGLGVPAMTTTVLASVDRSSSGIAGGVLNSARQAAGVIGVAVFGALAGDGREHVVSALHLAAMSSVVLLLAAALIVYLAATPARDVRQNM
jgi:DHA2 family methylenomycin A resistance protein-like MFS transporter